jgi:hypothetical protein
MIETTEIKRRIYGKLDTLGLKGDKDDIVSNFTSGRTTHLGEMAPDELISLLDKLSGNINNTDYLHYGKFDKENKQHLYILSMCMQLGWQVFNKNVDRNVADLARLGRFIMHFGAIKKPLMEQRKEELSKIVYQLEEMVRKHFTKQ